MSSGANLRGPGGEGAGDRLEDLSPEQRRELLAELLRKRREEPREHPVSFAQRRLWFLDQLVDESAFYNTPVALRLLGELDVDALQHALDAIVARHEMLRTTFAASDGEPVQVVSAPAPLALERVDLARLESAEQERALQDSALELSRRPFDLEHGPLLRARLATLGEREHGLLLAVHHIAYDGWSNDVFLRELVALYDAELDGRPTPLPPLPLQYGDYASWQREWLTGDVLERHLAHGRRVLGDAPILELPTDHPRPPIQQFDSARQAVHLSEDVTRALEALSRKQGATLFMTVLAALETLLQRYSGQDDIVVGTPIAGRSRAEVEPLVGCFINSVVLRTDLSGDPTFRELVTRVRETSLDAFEHGELPFERLVEELRPERDLSRNPLFQVLFMLQGGGAGTALPASDRLTIHPIELDSGTTRLDLEVYAFRAADGMRLTLNHRVDLFEPETIARMLRHLVALLEGVAHDPDRRLSELPLLDAAERRLVLETWNDTALDVPADACVHELVRAQAERTPEAVAVVSGHERLTYAELGARSGQLAKRLAALGVGRGDLVGLHVERGVSMVVAQLGVFESGAAYVPLDPAYPGERLGYMLSDSGARVLLTTSTLRAGLPAHDAQVLELDADDLATPADTPVATRASPDDLAYVIYTSGSTGRPKGVQIRHASVVNFLASMARAPGLGPDDVLVAVTTLSFDMSVLELLLPLTAGAQLVVASREEVSDGERLAALLRDVGATLLQGTPSTFRLLLAAGWSGDDRLTAIVGGEAWGPDLSLPLLERCSAVWNGYGPTEATVYSAVSAVPDDGRVVVGRPIANAAHYVLDAHRQPVPVGIPGELFLGGAGLSPGYLGRPDLTRERFVPHPFDDTPGARIYRTGDRVRWRPDGTLEFFGRLDTQVKLRGFRIELGEIESVLSTHPSVGEVVAVIREDRPGDRRLVAYVVPCDGGRPGSDELRAHLRTKLPEYMLPAACVTLDELPRTPNGKVDRTALPVPDVDPRARAGEWVAPAGPVEELLASLLSGVLGVERVGARDDFFELGGHSLLATQLVSRIRDAFDVELPLAEVFTTPVVSELAARIEEHRGGRDGRRGPALVVRERDAEPPLSFQQVRLWFLHQLEPDSAAYNMPLARRLLGPLDLEALARALEALVARHGALRTTFVEVDGRPHQRIAAELSAELDVDDLSALAKSDREERLAERVGAEARRPFDLATGPLLRAGVVRLAAEEHVLLLTMHHIVSDAWSLDVLLSELSQLYAGFLEGRAVTLPELPIQYADYATWQRDWLAGEVLDAELAWWRETLGTDATAIDLPTDRPRPRVQRLAGASESASIDRATVAALRELANAEGASLFMVLLAAFEVLLMRSSGTEDIVVGTPISGRNHTEVEGLVGFFINTLVLRSDLSGAPTFRELMRRVRRSTLDAFSHQEIPFEKLVEELAPERDLSRNPLFQVFVNMIDVSEADGIRLPGLRSEPAGAGMEISKFDLTLYLFRRGDELSVRLNYDVDLFEPPSIRAMLRRLATLLAAIVADPDSRITALPLHTDAERRALATHRNADVLTHAFTPFGEEQVEQSVGERFAAQVARAPDQPAVVMPDAAWSYGELDAASIRAASAVVEAVGGSEPRRVALLLHPGPRMLAGVLGVLRAGHAYVPLDPAYPEAWLRDVLRDTRAAAIVTEARRAPLARDLAGDTPVLDLQALDTPPLDGNALSAAASALPRVAPDAVAYVRYTSGSTGRPKGVVQSHRGLLAHIRAYTNSLHVDASDRLTLLSSYTFDGGLMDIYAALLNGATLCPLAFRERTPEELADALDAAGVTIYHSTPSAFRHLAGGLAPGRTFDGIRLVVFGGEEPRPDDVLLFQVHFGPACWLVNGLGATESSQALQAFHDRDSPLLRQRVPIGRAIDGTDVVLLDADGEETDVFGEIGIRSDHVALGYLDQPELTATTFSGGPVGRGSARLYRSGDLARRLADGRLEWMGRRDAQIKIRGHRVEPGEIAAALRALDGVVEAAVVARTVPSGETRLVGYVVPDAATTGDTCAGGQDARGGGAGGVDPAALRAELRARLPEHMVPAAIVLLGALPTTPAGKLDARALPEPEWSTAQRHGAFVPPANLVEERLAEIYADVLGIDRVGGGDHFFELGGHSLLATQVVSRVREALDVELPLLEIFEHPDVAGLARRVETLRASARQPDGPALQALPEDAALPLSFGQERFWFLEQLQPGTAALNMHAAFRLGGALDVGALRAALTEIVRRHAVLRTSFPQGAEGEPLQRIAEAGPCDLPATDLAALAPDAREVEVQRLATEAARTPFDVAAGPVVRFRLLRLADDDHVCLLTLHHMVGDAWSMGIFWRELFALTAAFAAGRPSPLAELPLRYADFAAWQRTWLVDERLATQIDYWTSHLAGAPPVLELPTDRPRPAVETFAGGRCSHVLEPTLTAALEALSAERGTTLFMTLLAGFQALLMRYARQPDIVVGIPVAGRTRTETEGLLGLFVNSLVLRTDLSGDPTFAELLERVRAVSLGAFAHQELPFERLVQELRPPRDLSHHPLFQVMFVLQNAPREGLQLPGLDVRLVATERTTSPFDLTLFAWEASGRIVLTAEYKSDLFDATTIDALLVHLETLLDGAVADPERRLSALTLLREDERRHVLEAWNASEDDVSTDTTLHGLVEAQVARTPEAVAVEFEGQALTYRELDERAQAVARRLVALGVGRGDRVGICLERGTGLLPALLGVLKTGAAYVPLDPTHPAERLAFILGDAEVDALLAEPAHAERLGLGDVPVLLPEVDGDGTPEERALGDVGDRAGRVDPGGREGRVDAGDGTGRVDAGDREGRVGAGDGTGRVDAGGARRVDAGGGASPDDLAYLIYTSGSTGRPKGVEIPHRAVVNFLLAMQQTPGLSADDVLFSVTTLAFDIAVLELFGPLTVGARVVLVPADVATDGLQLEQRISRSRATVCQATPATWQLLLEAGWPGDRRLKILCGGEAWSRGLADELLPRCGSLWNMYGPTETTIWSAVQRVEPGPAPVAIGVPIANTRLYVLDEHGEPLPVGVPGELCIGGAGLARGYWKRAELTAERFVPDPFVATPDARLYRTGDLVRRRADGTLDFLGRLDHQVKVNGFRIELGEIESVLGAHAAVREVVAAARSFGPDDTRLVAWVAAEPGGGTGPDELRALLRSQLPDYMVPGAFVMLEALPRTPNGKIDRAALADPVAERRPVTETSRLPSTPLERQLATIWQDLLGLDQVSVVDNFFDLGGHSLLSMRVVARLERESGVRIKPGDLILQTLGQVAALYERDGDASHGTASVAEPLAADPSSVSDEPGGAGAGGLRGLARKLLGRKPRDA